MVDDLYVYVKFVAGTVAEATERVQAHFIAAGLKSEIISTPEALELAKLLETTYFGLLIAWAQEMNRFAGAVNADYFFDAVKSSNEARKTELTAQEQKRADERLQPLALA